MKRVMIDIETLGVRNDAVVLSIAAVPFDFNPAPGGLVDIQPGLVWYPSLREQFALGRTVSEGTLEWWMRDDLAQARLNWAMPKYGNPMAYVDESIADVYQGFAAAVEGADEVWAHGVVFDIGIIESLFAGINERAPWKSYNVVRDVRTLARVLPPVRFAKETTPEAPGLVPHDPISDCIIQIWDLWSRWPEEPKENVSPFPPEYRPVGPGFRDCL